MSQRRPSPKSLRCGGESVAADELLVGWKRTVSTSQTVPGGGNMPLTK